MHANEAVSLADPVTDVETRVETVAVDLAPDSLDTYDSVCDGYVSDLIYR
jgi:hypothetical protein